MKEYRKKIYDVFCERLQENYHEYCINNELPQSLDGLITYLIDHDIIKAVTVRHYSIGKEYLSLSERVSDNKTTKIRRLSEEYNLSERTVWAAVKMLEREK